MDKYFDEFLDNLRHETIMTDDIFEDYSKRMGQIIFDNNLSEGDVSNYLTSISLDMPNTFLIDLVNRTKRLICDGPPFRSGNTLHHGHALISYLKSIMINYYGMEDNPGNDCHGLPIELLVQKLYPNITDQNEFIGQCIETIKSFSGSWYETFDKLGRNFDRDSQYFTMDTNYMESVWWAFKELWKKGLVYGGHTVMPYSTGCKSVLSNFEASSNYKMENVDAVYAKFKVTNSSKTFLLAWTTTPWTLPSNVALAVNKNFTYNLVYSKEEFYIVVQGREKMFPEGFTIIKTFKGEKLEGLTYKPLFPYFEQHENKGNMFKVICDDYVTNDSGTGVVHIAPGFGKDDFRVCLKNKIVTMENVADFCPIDSEGRFTQVITEYSGQQVFDISNTIYLDLKKNKKIYKKETIVHKYPYCWRTQQRLITRLSDGVFIRVTAIKDKMIENNKKVNWHSCGNRFSRWISNIEDWCVSRDRPMPYGFGIPIPIWKNEIGEEICIGSIDELCSLTNLERLTDLHLHTIKDITIPSPTGGPPLKLIRSVLDCWFDSGAAPFASYHYPFENKELIDNRESLTDIVCEGIDQTRGWFYTTHALATALFDKPAFKNVICTGLVLAEDGSKMSKSNNNAKSLVDVIDKYNSDSMRVYLSSSIASKGESFIFSENELSEVYKTIYWFEQSFTLFETCSQRFITDGNTFNKDYYKNTTHVIDKWILSRVNTLKKQIRNIMTTFNFTKLYSTMYNFVEDLTNWYANLNKHRLKGFCGIVEQHCALSTLYQGFTQALFSMKSFLPFTFQKYSSLNIMCETYIQDNIEESMKELQIVTTIARKLREKTDCPNKKRKLYSIEVYHHDEHRMEILRQLESYLKEELNCENIVYPNFNDSVETKFKADLKKIGSKFGKRSMIVKNFIEGLQFADNYHEILTQKFPELSREDYTLIYLMRRKLANNEYLHNDMESGYKLIMNTFQTPEAIEYFEKRDLFSSIQKMRKAAGFKTHEFKKAFYTTTKPDNDLISQNRQFYEKGINCTFESYDQEYLKNPNKVYTHFSEKATTNGVYYVYFE